MKKIWIVEQRDDLCGNISCFAQMDDVHDYGNMLLSQFRMERYESDPEGECFSKERLRKRGYQNIFLGNSEYTVDVTVEKKEVR